MAGYDGSIRIKALLNHSQFDTGVRAMSNSIKALQSTLMKLAGAVGLAFGVAAIVNFGKEGVKAASELSDAWMGLQSIVEGQGRSFSKAKAFIEDYISDGLVPLTDAVTAYKNLAARGYNDEQIQKTMIALKDAAAFGRQSTYSLGQAVATAAEGLKNENSILVDNAGVTKNVAKMWDEYAKSIGTTANNLTQEQKIQAEVNGILEETRFQTGDAAKLVNTYSGQVAMLGFNFQQLKVQVGNAIMPIVQAVLPGINAIISALLKLAKVFAQVTALLFGKPNPGTAGQVSVQEEIASSGIAAADATDKLADSTAGAGEAAKKAEKDMKGVLASFDELNVLADSASGSLDSASGGLDAGGIDAEIPELDLDGGAVEEIGEKFKSLGELFSATIDKMLEGLPALRETLLEAARNFNEFNQKLYDAFTFPGLKEKVQKLGRELADILNDFVNEIDWELWGRALGAGLNLGLNFLTSFLYRFDWVNLGKKLAEFINGLVYEIDWYEFGRLLWAKFKIALETLAGFLLGLDMPALAQAASDIIMGFFDEMKNTIDRMEWGEIGKQIAEFLNNIDWIGVIKSIYGALQGMIGAALEAICGFISEADTGTLIAAAVFLGSKLVRNIISTVIAPVAKEIASNLIKKIAESVIDAGAGGLSSAIGSAIAKMGLLTVSVGIGLTLIIKAIKNIISDGLNIGDALVGAIGGAVAGAGVGFTVGGPAGAALGAVIGVGLTLAIEGVTAQIAGGIDIIGGLTTIIGTALAGAGIGFAVGGPVGAFAGAAIGLTAGVLLEVIGVRAAGESIYQATEDFQVMKRVIDECEDSSKRSSSALQILSKNIDNLGTSLADAGAAQTLVDEIYAINENANASAYELELMATKVELLNSMGLDGLHLTIDETTGRIIETKEATDQLILSLQKEAETAALQELLVQAYKDRYAAVADAEEAVKNVTVAEQALAETERELTNTPWWDLEKHAALTAQQEKQTEALEAATEARDLAVTAYDELSGAIDTYSGALTDLEEPEANVGVTLEERMSSVRQTLEGVAEDMPEYGKNIGEGLEKGMDEGVNEEKTKSIFGRIGDWFKDLFEIHSPSAVFSKFAGFLMSGLYKGLIENLSPITKFFSDLWASIKTGIQNFWSEVKSWWGGNVSKYFTAEYWKNLGKTMIDGLLQGLRGIFDSLSGWASDVWNTITGAFSVQKAKSSISRGMNYSPRLASVEYASYSVRDLPRLAQGAVIPPNQQFAAILGDQRSGMNFEAPAALVRQMVDEGLQAAITRNGGFGGGGNMTVIMEIDGREFGRASYQYGTAERQRVGVSLTEART